MKRIFLSSLLLIVMINSYSQINYAWSKSFGSANDESINASTIDGSGNTYATGAFFGVVDFDPGPGTYTLSAPSGAGFVTKTDASGNFVWARHFAGMNGCWGYGIHVDASGNVYSTGQFLDSCDFDPGPAQYLLEAVSMIGAYVSKLDASGNFVWAKHVRCSGFNVCGYGIKTDPTGNVYINGIFQNTVDFDPGPGSYTLTANSANFNDVFVWKLDGAGNFVWARGFGGPYDDWGMALTLDANNNVYTTGQFEAVTDFDPGASTTNLTTLGWKDAFISKLDVNGNFVWAKQMGGLTAIASASAITMDASDNIICLSSFNGNVDFDPGPATYTLSSSGNSDVAIMKLDPSGNFLWTKSFGGTGQDEGRSITADVMGDIYYSGHFESTVDFDPGAGTYTLTTPPGYVNAYVAKLNSNGFFIAAGQFYGFANSTSYGIDVDAAGTIYTTGYFRSIIDFDPGTPIANLTSLGGFDPFICKLTKGPVGMNEISFEAETVLFPNPNSGQFSLRVDAELKNGTLEIYNVLGQTIFTQHVEEGINALDTKQLAKGIYSYSVLDNKQQLSNGKLVIE